jgi:hypothetical protein
MFTSASSFKELTKCVSFPGIRKCICTKFTCPMEFQNRLAAKTVHCVTLNTPRMSGVRERRTYGRTQFYAKPALCCEVRFEVLTALNCDILECDTVQIQTQENRASPLRRPQYTSLLENSLSRQRNSENWAPNVSIHL